METLVEVLRQLLRDIRNQKLRTFLTVFGLVWGTVAVTLLLAFGTGLKKPLQPLNEFRVFLQKFRDSSLISTAVLTQTTV